LFGSQKYPDQMAHQMTIGLTNLSVIGSYFLLIYVSTCHFTLASVPSGSLRLQVVFLFLRVFFQLQED